MTASATLLITLAHAMINLDRESVKIQVEQAVSQEIASQQVIGSLREGMKVVGERFAQGEYFLSELSGRDKS